MIRKNVVVSPHVSRRATLLLGDGRLQASSNDCLAGSVSYRWQWRPHNHTQSGAGRSYGIDGVVKGRSGGE
jgi:hypothetical protein